MCGAGYAPEAPLCDGGCAVGYYPSPSGLQCLPCPALPSTSDRLWAVARPAAIGLGILSAVLLVMLALVTVVLRRVGGTFAGGVRRTLAFAISAVLCVQAIAQVAAVLRGLPGLSPPLRAVLAVVEAFNIQTTTASHPACSGSPPFLWPQILFACSLGACVALAAVLSVCDERTGPGMAAVRTGRCLARTAGSGCRKQRLLQRAAPKAASKGSSSSSGGGCVSASRFFACTPSRLKHWRVALFTLVSLLYSVVAGAGLRLLSCRETLASVPSYSALDNDGTTLLDHANADLGCVRGADGGVVCPQSVSNAAAAAASGRDALPLFKIAVLAEDPGYVCWEGSHRRAASLALAALLVVCAAFPAAAGWWVAGRVAARRRASAAAVRAGTLAVGAGRAAGVTPAYAAAAKHRAASVSSSAVASRASRLSWGRPSLRVSTSSAAEAINPPALAAASSSTSSSSSSSHVLLLDGDPYVIADDRLSWWIRGPFRPSRWWWRLVELLTTLALAALATFAPASSASLVGGVSSVLAISTVVLLLVRPYSPDLTWNVPVRVLAAVVAALALGCAYLAGPCRDGVTPVPPALEPLSLATLVIAIALVVALVVGFWVAVLRGAAAEEAVRRLRAAATAAGTKSGNKSAAEGGSTTDAATRAAWGVPLTAAEEVECLAFQAAGLGSWQWSGRSSSGSGRLGVRLRGVMAGSPLANAMAPVLGQLPADGACWPDAGPAFLPLPTTFTTSALSSAGAGHRRYPPPGPFVTTHVLLEADGGAGALKSAVGIIYTSTPLAALAGSGSSSDAKAGAAAVPAGAGVAATNAKIGGRAGRAATKSVFRPVLTRELEEEEGDADCLADDAARGGAAARRVAGAPQPLVPLSALASRATNLARAVLASSQAAPTAAPAAPTHHHPGLVRTLSRRTAALAAVAAPGGGLARFHPQH